MSSGELEQARSVLRLKAFERVQAFRHRAVEKDPDFGDGSGLKTSLQGFGGLGLHDFSLSGFRALGINTLGV